MKLELFAKKNLFYVLVVILITALVTVSFNLTYAQTKEECELGDGIWTIPNISIGDDPEFTKNDLTPYCSCKKGFFWNTTTKKCEDDSQLRCIQTEGKWVNNSCQCPEGTIKWSVGFGCDTQGPVPN